MKRILAVLLYIVALSCARVDAADSANDLLLIQRKSDNSGSIQRNVAPSAGGLLGFNGSMQPIPLSLGSGIATFLATPSSANLAAAMTDETGSGALVFAGGNIGAATATTASIGDNSTKVATTAYVDASIADDIDIKNPAVATTTGALPFSPTYNNGASGVGATLTGTVGILTLDGYTPVLGDRLLIKNQASTFQNGVYTVTTVGTVGVGYVLTRATDFNQAANIVYGDTVAVLQGTANANQQFTMNNQNAITVGTTAITFAQTSGGSQLTSGTGISITGNTVAIATSAALPGSPTVSGTASTATGGVVTIDGTQTLGNKTLTSPVVGNATYTGTGTVSGTPGAGYSFDNPDTGDSVYTNSGGGYMSLNTKVYLSGTVYDHAKAVGSSGQLLKYNGSSQLLVGSDNGCYTLKLEMSGGGSLAAGTNYYFGWSAAQQTTSFTNEGRYKFYIPQSGTITKVVYGLYGGGGDSGHSLTVDVWLSNATSVGSTTLVANVFPGYATTTPSQAVTAWNGSTGDYIELRVQAPAGMTTITSTQVMCVVYITTTL